MADLVVTVPKHVWAEWCAEGDPAGSSSSGEEWGFYLGRSRPPIRPGERLYIVAHDRVRGYAPVTRVDKVGERWAVGRRGDAVAVTIPKFVVGFRGWRERWWDRKLERPFPQWAFAGMPSKQGHEALLGACVIEHEAYEMRDGPAYLLDVLDFVLDLRAQAGPSMKVADLIAPLSEQLQLELEDATALALWAGSTLIRWWPAPRVMVDEFKLWLPKQPRPFHEGSSHLTVDGEGAEHIEALHELAAAIGLKRSWYQDKSAVHHYDLTASKRELALRHGAVFVPAREQARQRIARRTTA